MQNVLSEFSNHDLFKWAGSHSDFITMVMLLSGPPPENPDDPDAYEHIDAVGEVMLKMVEFDITPYPDFQSMRRAVPPSMDFMLKLMAHLNEKIAFEEVIDDTGVEPSQETQLNTFIDAALGDEMARRMRAYVRFRDDPE